MNVKQVIEEETERSPFYSRGQLFTFHISFAHTLFPLYISNFIRIQPVFILHFKLHLRTPCFPFCFTFHSLTPCFRCFAQNSRQRLQPFSRQRHLYTLNWYSLTLRYKRALNPEKSSIAFNLHSVCSILCTSPSAINWTLESGFHKYMHTKIDMIWRLLVLKRDMSALSDADDLPFVVRAKQTKG